MMLLQLGNIFAIETNLVVIVLKRGITVFKIEGCKDFRDLCNIEL